MQAAAAEGGDGIVSSNNDDICVSADEPQNKIIGSWGTKIDTICQKILSVCKEDPEAKILVFSQWEDVLSIVLRALESNEIRVVRIQGNHKITQRLNSFKTDVGVRVLLLPIKSAGGGLNLTEASHVIMVEPMLNIGLEKQAVSDLCANS